MWKCPVCFGDRSNPKAGESMKSIVNILGLGFTFNPGGGEFYDSARGFRCQIGTNCDECDDKKLRAACLDKFDFVLEVIQGSAVEFNPGKWKSSPSDPKIEKLRDQLLKLPQSERLDYLAKQNGNP